MAVASHVPEFVCNGSMEGITLDGWNEQSRCAHVLSAALRSQKSRCTPPIRWSPRNVIVPPHVH